MKRSILVLTFASLVMFSSAPTYGAAEITLDNMTGLLGGDTVWVDSTVRWNFRLTYTPGDGSAIYASINGFRVWAHSGGAYTDNFTAITYDTFSWGWPDLYDLIFVIKIFGIDGLGADTVGFAGSKLMGTGIPDGTDTLCWWIETMSSTDGDTLCIDSSYYYYGDCWVWTTTAGTVIPGWDGPHCFLVWECCVGIRGNVDGLAGINIADLIYLVEYLFYSGPVPPCPEEGDANGSGSVGVDDLTYLVDYLFFQGPAPLPCP